MPDPGSQFWIHPGAILILGALLVPLIRGPARQGYLLLLPALALLSVFSSQLGTYWTCELLGQEVVFGRVDKLSLVFGYVFCIAAFISVLYGLRVKEAGHQVSALLYAGGGLGVTFAGDFITLFVFWEVMAFSSVFLILYRKTEDSYAAAYRYVLVHVFGGVCLLGGAILQYSITGSIEFTLMELTDASTWLILIGFMVNAAVLPFNAWLPDAYPRATVSGAVFMSAFTTKSAVYVLLRGFSGTDMLIYFGVAMAIYGVVYAILENDIRRVQSYSIVSQVGYMVAGVGIGTELASNGVVAHAFAHILYKGLLFMATGSVLYMTGRSAMTELGGLSKYMPRTFVFYMVGALAISAFPLFSGFVSKSLILTAAAEEHLTYSWLLLSTAAAGTFLYTGLKLPYLVFLGGREGIDRFGPGQLKEGEKAPTDPPLHMQLAMAIAAILCVFFGVYPEALYGMLPYAMHYEPYTPEHVVWSLEILFFTALAFTLFAKTLVATPTINIDTDWFYRKFGRIFISFARGVVAKVDDAVSNSYKTFVIKWGRKTAAGSYKFDSGVVDGIVNGVAAFVVSFAGTFRRVQTGLVHDYALGFLAGVLVLISFFLLAF